MRLILLSEPSNYMIPGMLVLGPRLGRFEKGNEKLFAMGNPSNVVLGTFMLWWGWIGFNSGAQMVISGGKR